jgi:hypothetical protein
MNSLLIAYSPSAIEELLEIERYLESKEFGTAKRFRDEFDAELELIVTPSFEFLEVYWHEFVGNDF